MGESKYIINDTKPIKGDGYIFAPLGESKYIINGTKPIKGDGYIFAPYIACADGNIDVDAIQREILKRNRSEKLKKILNKKV